jgi:hypothetical protein
MTKAVSNALSTGLGYKPEVDIANSGSLVVMPHVGFLTA